MDFEDRLLLKTLKDIRAGLVAEKADHLRTDGENGRIGAEYEESIARLDRLLPEIREVFDIYRLEEEDFVFVIEALEMYCEAFVIDGRTESSRKRDEKEFRALQDFLDQFYDDSDDEGDDDEEDGEGEGGSEEDFDGER
ncbi:hypothetical protein [uncultured Treponema sp.]|uniref:hypothetical protein n=1 Tax=uncultured Treponema sp. TaxID=162155 RepID=UPI0015BBAA0B|nr:hypothetical protein [uncultured Treponema sp.]